MEREVDVDVQAASKAISIQKDKDVKRGDERAEGMAGGFWR